MDHHLLVQQLCAVTNVSEDEARHLLEAFHWNVEDAIQAHFETEQDATVSHPEQSVPVDKEKSLASIPKATTTSQKVITFDSIRNLQKDGSEEGQAFYVGGSETGGGGQQVLGPPMKSSENPDPNLSPEEFVHSLFQAAKGQGAEVIDTERYLSSLDKPKKPAPFSGTGYTLGEDPLAPSVVATTSEGKSNAEEKRVIVKMWRDGFSLNDGSLRSYTDPDSKTFLEDIKAGKVPTELVKGASGGLVNVLLEDHHHEMWRAPPPKIVPFSGKGTMLGHPVPRLATNDVTTNGASSSLAPSVNTSEPVTQLQIRLPDGGRLLVRLNHSHTVSDVRHAVVSQQPSLASCPFVLMTAFPNRELKDEEQTLVEANLLNSVLLVHLT